MDEDKSETLDFDITETTELETPKKKSSKSIKDKKSSKDKKSKKTSKK